MTNVDRYIEKFAKKIATSLSGRSRYYQVEDKVIRVSDHIGKNSDGFFQIIVKPNGYLIYHPGTGTINICSYRQVQEFIRTIMLFPVDDRSKQDIIMSGGQDQYVLGIPTSALSKGQLETINSIIKKVRSKTACD